MRCKECNKIMKADIENERYICECGQVIKWSGVSGLSDLIHIGGY